MQNIELIFPEEIYSEHLATINGIKFTHREIDVISCLLSARRTSQIASILSIAPRTVTTHFRNIMLRLDCNSQEGIISFIEKSQKLSLLREYYVGLITEIAFEKGLKEVSKLKHEGSPHGLVIYWEDENLKQILLTHLGAHLNLAGFKVEIREYGNTYKVEIPQAFEPILVSLAKRDLCTSCLDLENLNSLDLTELSNYYFAAFEILKKLLPKADINKIFATFQDHYRGLQDPSKEKMILEKTSKKLKTKEINSLNRILQIFQDRKWPLGVGIICISFLIIGCWVIREKEGQGVTANSHQAASPKKDDSIRSDLVIPTEAVLLNRPELITEIDNKLKNQHGIQTVALVGPGGAGKTTLSRQYAHEQKASVIWEINAETNESLRSSFEDLARALAKTEESKNALGQIENLKDPEVRERKIIQFVREQLLVQPNWFLVFDNIENFSDIQKYFPQDSATWGQGRIILTTRNNNIESNKHINGIMQIGELTSDQKVKLFIKIVSQDNKAPFTHPQMEELKAFLEHIPPFPLDVSIAAYYLKATQIPYADYLENLSKCNKDFEDVQKSLLKEAGDYTKTRYGIISLSLQHMINSHKDFLDLLLFISLLDSQNIPKDLLSKFKDKTIVDNFVYNLKKHSFITNESDLLTLGIPIFSIHRSIQTLALTYLLQKTNSKEKNNLIKSISCNVEEYISDALLRDDISKMRFLLRHVEALLAHNNISDEIIQAAIFGELGCVYTFLGDNAKAKFFHKKSLEILSKSDCEKYPEAGHSLAYQSIICKYVGDNEKARKLLERGINICKNFLPRNRVEFATFSAWLGGIYRTLGNYKKAKSSFQQSFVNFNKLSPKDEINEAWALTQLSRFYEELGFYKKSKDLIASSLLVYNKHLPKDHIRIVWALTISGSIYNALENYGKAKNLLEQSLLILDKHVPKDHHYVANTLMLLGDSYKGLKNYGKAKNLFNEGLIIYEKLFSKSYLEIGYVLENLGQVYLLEGNLETAEGLFKKALDIFEKNNHPAAYKVFEDFADLYLKKADLEKKSDNRKQPENFKAQVISSLKQALDIVKAHFPEDSPHIARIEAKLKKLEGEFL